MARRLRGLTPGFTILELLFALAIAGTLTTIAVPQGLRALDDFRTRAAARYLAQRLCVEPHGWSEGSVRFGTDAPVMHH